ncbi:MAG: LPS export ABC transporter periplasmic protein LptC [Gammaproteobacteria bacterium]|nr:LPS export ABC transporter periplasmic protein LptC [Gammaproteobacteria bacterium]
MKRTISLIIISALALLSWWFQDIWKEAPIIQPKKDEHFPDYFMENFTLTNMDEKGQPSYILRATKMLHFSDNNSSELEQPRIHFLGEKGDWTVTAEQALILEDSNQIQLKTNVKLNRNASAQQTPLAIDTEYLSINTLTEIVETHTLTQINSEGVSMTSTGLVYDNRNKILKLLSEVKGIYETTR